MEYEAAKLLTQRRGEIYEKYSHRFSDKPTTGVTFNDESMLFEELSFIMEHGPQKVRNVISKMLRNLKTDQLGLGVIYY